MSDADECPDGGNQQCRCDGDVTDHGPDGDPAKRYYVTVGGFGAASWSPEAARAIVRQMKDAARRAELGPLPGV